MKKLAMSLIASAGVVMLLASCSADAGTSLVDDSNTDSGNKSGNLTELTVGVLPASDSVPVYFAESEGIFEKHGLDVTIETAGGGAAITASVLSGSFDLGLSNLVSTYVAQSEGFPVTIVSPGSSSTGNIAAGEDYAAVLASPGSAEITGILDLEGRTIATNALNNANEVLVREAVERAGGDPQTLKFVEISFPDLPGALANNQVDAAVVPEPFMTMALDTGSKWVYPVFADVVEDYPASIYVSTTDYAEANKETLKKFREAYAEAAEIVNNDDAQAREVLASYTEMDPELLSRVVLPVWPTELNQAGVDELYDLTAKFGVIEASEENKSKLVSIE